MGLKFITESILQNVADAIRGKDGTSAPIEPVDFAQRITDIPSGGGGNPELEALIEGTATGDFTVTGSLDLSGVDIIMNNAVNTVSKLTLAGATKAKLRDPDGNSTLTELNLPACTEVTFDHQSGAYSFPNMVTLNAPAVRVFRGVLTHSGLTALDLPACVEIKNPNGFTGCSSMATANLPVCEKISMYAFQNCTGLRSVDLPVCIYLNSYAFYGSGLTSVVLPVCTNIGVAAFTNCRSLVSATFKGEIPNALDSTFQGCTVLETVDLWNSHGIGQRVFNETGLTALILRKSDAIVVLRSVLTFTNSPVASGTGYIYVPRDMIAAYQSATNWTVYSAQFRALEDYTDDGTISGNFVAPA